MKQIFLGVVLGVLTVSGVYLYSKKEMPIVHNEPTPSLASTQTQDENPIQQNNSEKETTQKLENTTPASFVTDKELLVLADNKYADGVLPLGDNMYTTSGPKKGYIYACRVTSGGGAQVNGSWIHGAVWNLFEKISVKGNVLWSNAWFKTIVSNSIRTITGNGLPVNEPTGSFPVAQNDPAYKVDRNPNTITTQTLSYSLPVDPVYSDTPSCIGGEVGIMLNGVPLFNGFDAGMRDAAAHEVQDLCQGHPQEQGEYHYHSLSSCFSDTNVKTVLGYALDGFPITGPLVAKDKYLTTEDLDVCHGITSTITEDGKEKVTYHYVMTQDFPYSVSCFRGTVVQKASQVSGSTILSNTSQQGTGMTPPQGAIIACSGKQTGNSCSFTTPNGTVSGSCRIPPNQTSLACIP